MTEKQKNPEFSVIFLGLLGGIVGAVFTGLVTLFVPPLSAGRDPLFAEASAIAGTNGLTWSLGWLLHVGVGMVVGAIAGLALSRSRLLRLQRVGPRILAAMVIGVVAWLIVFLPAMSLIPNSATVGSVSSGLLVNVIFGIIIVVTFGIGQVFMMTNQEAAEYSCEVCGEGFGTYEGLEMHRHSGLHHPKRTQEPVDTRA